VSPSCVWGAARAPAVPTMAPAVPMMASAGPTAASAVPTMASATLRKRARSCKGGNASTRRRKVSESPACEEGQGHKNETPYGKERGVTGDHHEWEKAKPSHPCKAAEDEQE
jgi:hypothetical protein